MSLPPAIDPPETPTSDRLPTEPSYIGVPRSAVGWLEIGGAILVVLGASIVGFILISLVDPSLLDANTEDESDGAALGLQAFTVLGFIGAAFGATMIANGGGGADAARRLGLGRFGPRILTTIAMAVGLYLIAGLLINAVFNPTQEDIAETLGAGDGAPLLVTVAAGVLIIGGAAISEELFFRGLLFGGLRQRLSLWPAALISGVIFGLPHLPTGDLAVVLQLSLFGVILAWAYERTGVLWTAIALHAMNNTIAFLVLIDVLKV